MSLVGAIARMGSICPASGVWKVVGTPSTNAQIAKGNRMLPCNGQAVDWQLISACATESGLSCPARPNHAGLP
ncbi:hypothetical protein DSM43518_00214 [Mycobacterium marinum]|nr:hypothetical protein DSM43518_00214 [Mycobacterium marinum]RFZ47120.1 hypothetical protein MSS2_05315 [Mycobacterium marinum]